MHKSLLTLLLTAFIFAANCGQKTPNSKIESDSENASVEAAADPGDWTTNKGIGPVSSISFNEIIDDEMAAKGENIFVSKCSACHKPSKRYIGPAMAGIFERRTPEWTANMILNPMEMVQKDPIAKELLMEFNGTPMANQNLTEDEARAVLEYFRTLKSE